MVWCFVCFSCLVWWGFLFVSLFLWGLFLGFVGWLVLWFRFFLWQSCLTILHLLLFCIFFLLVTFLVLFAFLKDIMSLNAIQLLLCD